EGYNYREYAEGLHWVEHAGGFKGVLRRHLPALRAKLEGVRRGFAPWPEPETFPERLLTESQNDTGKAFRADLRTLVIAAVPCAVLAWSGLVAWWLVLSALGLLFAGSVVTALTRMLARRFLQECEKKCYTDRRQFMLQTLHRAERWIRRASLASRLGAAAVMLLSAALAVWVWSSAPWVSALFVLTGLCALSTVKWSRAFTDNVGVLTTALRNRMQAGQPASDDSALDGNPVDPNELDRLLVSYAPGRDYLTAYDFARLHEGERVRTA